MNNSITYNSLYYRKFGCVSKRSIAFSVLFFLLIFQNILEQQIGFIKYTDEILSFVFLIYFITSGIKTEKKLSRDLSKILIAFLGFAFFVIISTFINSKQTHIAEILDLIAIVKFPATFLGASLYFDRRVNKRFDIGGIIKLIITYLFLYFIIDLFFNFNHSTELHFKGLFHVITLGFRHETFLNASLVILMGGAHLFIHKKKKIYIFMCFILMACTFKSKAYLFFAAYLYMYYSYGKKLSKRVVAVGMSCILIYYFVVDKIMYYWSGTGDLTARRAFITTCIFIAFNYFPFGLGLGNFGSYVARDYYPKYYYEFGFNKIWGLYPENPKFFSDHFWPTIIGEAGAIGCVCYIVFLFLIYKRIKERCKDKIVFLGCITPFLYILCASVAESSIFNSYSALYGLCLALFLSQAKAGIAVDEKFT